MSRVGTHNSDSFGECREMVGCAVTIMLRAAQLAGLVSFSRGGGVSLLRIKLRYSSTFLEEPSVS